MGKINSILLIIIMVFFGLTAIDLSAQASILDFFYKSRDVLTIWGKNVMLNNNYILLRGVAVGDSHSRLTNDNRTSQDYEVIKKEWKANLVRLSVHPGVFKRDEKKGKKLLEQEVKMARDNGLFVIIDWHVIGVPNGWYKPCAWGEAHYYSYDSNFNTAKDFWKYAAIEFRSDRGVIFELWNEPADENNNETWLDIKPYMERLYDIVRSNGAENIIIAPGVWWTYDLRSIKDNSLGGENIAYAWHNYPSNSQKYINWDIALDDLNKHYPIFVTEWGFSDKADSSYYALINGYPNYFKNYLLDNSLNFTAWCWHSSWKPEMLKSNWQDTNVFGTLTKNLLIGIDTGLAYLKIEDRGEHLIPYNIQDDITFFIDYGVDFNSYKLGRGERKAVIYSYQKAYGHLPVDKAGMEDIKKIVNGRWPEQRSWEAENKAKDSFRRVYKREPDMNNKYDNAAITVMAYGLRQKAENRNLNSERRALGFFENIYYHFPKITEEWNVLQAITYSGATR